MADKTRTLNKKMLERLIMIHNLIKAGTYPNADRIMKFYEESKGLTVSRPTVYRDIQTLQTEFGAPIEYDHYHGGYYYLDDNFEFAVNQITSQEVFYLSAAKTLLSNFDGSPMYKEISQVIDFVTDTQTPGKSDLLNRIAIPPRPRVVIDESIWQQVMESLRENRILEFDYNGRWHTQTSHRRVHPYQILLEDGMYMVFGYDELAKKNDGTLGAERIFSLTRMKNLKLTGDTFELPVNFDFSSRCSGGRMGAFMGNQSQHQFVIEFYGDARQLVKDCIWAEDQVITDDEESGITTISFSSPQTLKVQEWVRSQGCNARPLAPQWFVDEWRDTICALYESICG